VNKLRSREGSLPYTGGVAAEPGLDYRTVDVEGFNVPTAVTIVDYSASQRSVSPSLHHVVEIEDYVAEPRPDWAKVRWINVNGLNWQCIKFLATKYNLHRLAIEDLLSVQRTKVDSYKDRNFSVVVAYCRHLYLFVDACARGGGR
jgi:Mg2+ and Co2+ transporter CorA